MNKTLNDKIIIHRCLQYIHIKPSKKFHEYIKQVQRVMNTNRIFTRAHTQTKEGCCCLIPVTCMTHCLDKTSTFIKFMRLYHADLEKKSKKSFTTKYVAGVNFVVTFGGHVS